MNERGQISIAACGLLVLLVLAGALIGYLGGIDQSGAGVQRAADMAALAAGRVLADDPNASLATLRAAAAAMTAARPPAPCRSTGRNPASGSVAE